VRSPDVIISDIGMPRMDGYDFIRTDPCAGGPRRAPRAGHRADGYAMGVDSRRAADAGYPRHVTKPVDLWCSRAPSPTSSGVIEERR